MTLCMEIFGQVKVEDHLPGGRQYYNLNVDPCCPQRDQKTPGGIKHSREHLLFTMNVNRLCHILLSYNNHGGGMGCPTIVTLYVQLCTGTYIHVQPRSGPTG